MKDIEEHLHQYLLQAGQTVYLQNTKIHGRRNKKVSVVSYSQEGVVDFFIKCHAKLVTNDDFSHLVEKYGVDGKLGNEIMITNGQMAIVLASFHWGHTEKEIKALLEKNVIKKPEEATPSVTCFLLVDDQFVIASHDKCNPVDL